MYLPYECTAHCVLCWQWNQYVAQLQESDWSYILNYPPATPHMALIQCTLAPYNLKLLLVITLRWRYYWSPSSALIAASEHTSLLVGCITLAIIVIAVAAIAIAAISVAAYLAKERMKWASCKVYCQSNEQPSSSQNDSGVEVSIRVKSEWVQ